MAYQSDPKFSEITEIVKNVIFFHFLIFYTNLMQIEFAQTPMIKLDDLKITFLGQISTPKF